MNANPCPNGCPTTGDHACPVTGGYITWVAYPWWKQREMAARVVVPHGGTVPYDELVSLAEDLKRRSSNP